MFFYALFSIGFSDKPFTLARARLLGEGTPMQKNLVAFALIALLTSTSQAATVEFWSSLSSPSPEAVAAGAPVGGEIFDVFVTTDADILSINQVLIDKDLFNVDSPFGSNTAPAPPEFVALNRALEADSWITTPGATALLGPDLDATDGTSAFGDLSNDGPQTDFHFARLTAINESSLSFSGRVSVAGPSGPEAFPFSLGYLIEGGFYPSLENGSTIDLAGAYLNQGGFAPAAISFSGFGSITSARVASQSIPGLFGASTDGLNIDLSVDLAIGRTIPAGTLATGELLVETENGRFNYSLILTPEPTSLALSSLSVIGLAVRRRK